jgi:hypothetical protein
VLLVLLLQLQCVQQLPAAVLLPWCHLSFCTTCCLLLTRHLLYCLLLLLLLLLPQPPCFTLPGMLLKQLLRFCKLLIVLLAFPCNCLLQAELRSALLPLLLLQQQFVLPCEVPACQLLICSNRSTGSSGTSSSCAYGSSCSCCCTCCYRLHVLYCVLALCSIGHAV